VAPLPTSGGSAGAAGTRQLPARPGPLGPAKRAHSVTPCPRTRCRERVHDRAELEVGNYSRVEGDKSAGRIEPRSYFPDASVDPTEARKDAGHAHAVGGTELGITDPTSEAPGPGSPAPCRQSAATLYSLVGSCERHQIDPFAYRKDILERLPAHPADRLGELLPDAWLETRPRARREVAS